MKNSITILSVVLLVSLGFTGVAQKSEQMNFKEMLSAKKSQQIEKNKTKSNEWKDYYTEGQKTMKSFH